MSDSKRIAMQIPMERDMELAVIKTAEQVARFMQFAADSIDEIKMALIEGIINASEHSGSPDKTVYIQFNMHDEELEVTIQDYGSGFDVKTRPPGVEPLQKRGYGLTLMHALMDHVELISGPQGTKVVMTKKRPK